MTVDDARELDDELAQHARALDRLDAVIEWPRRLDDDERDRVHALLDQYVAEHDRRVDAHVERLERVACQLGRHVAVHRVTLADACTRLDALAMTYDDTVPVPLLLVPVAAAVRIVDDAFARGYHSKDR
jgi:hypothetical protein